MRKGQKSWDGSAYRRECSVRISSTSTNNLKGVCKEDGARLLSLVSSDGTRDSGHELKGGGSL